MNKLRKYWFIPILVLATALFLGRHLSLTPVAAQTEPPLFPGPEPTLHPLKTPGVTALAPETDTKLRVFSQALSLVEEQYAEPKPVKDLVYGAIQWVVGTLDPHSSFMNPEEFRELQIETKEIGRASCRERV